ncbi:MAG: hypothetical protein AAF242_05420, partial [Bacteroidota bacterium]
LEKSLRPKQMSFQINVDQQLDTESILVPPLIIQPIVENAIKYGLDSSRTDNKILVSVNHIDKYIHIVISDSGSGSTNGKFQSKSSKGLNITKQRIQSWSSTHGMTGELVPIISPTGGPSEVLIKIPLVNRF